MKKLVSALLVLVLVVSLCAFASAEETIKVGLLTLHDENSTYDKNFIDGFTEACAACGVEGVVRSGVGEDQTAYDAACELADDGCAVIFADSYGHQPYILEAAMEYPEVQFTSCTGDMALAEGVENYHNAFASIYEGRFIAGVAAGLKLNEMIANGEFTAEEAKVGYVGAMRYAEVKSGYTAWYLGVRSVCPTVTMEVTFTNSWYDETLENEGANLLIQNGAKLISQHADSWGAPNACEKAGVPDVSYNGSTISACPNTFLISSRINWAPYFTYAIQAVQNGENFDTDWCGTIETGSVELTDVNEAVAAAGTAEKLAEVKAAILDGSLKIFDCSTWTVNGEECTSYLANVVPDDAFAPDTEVIIDGCFDESALRSAPYFDIDIDGITLLG